MGYKTKGKAKCIPEKPEVLMLPYQSKWIEDNSRIKLVEKSRQIGFSWATAYGIVRRGSMRDTKLDTWVSSRDEMQARLFLEDCKKFASLLDVAAKDVGENVYNDTGGKPYTSFDLRFSNGTSIHSMSSNADAQAGKRGTRVLDEFALHPDPVKLYSIAYPGITWGGSLEIISTHRGKDNFFNKLVDEIRYKGNPKNISHHKVTLETALKDGFLFKLQQKLPVGDVRLEMDEGDYFNFIKSGCADTESFLQEYMCEPADDASAYISNELIDACSYHPKEDWEISDLTTCKGELYIGVDIGRVNDLTVIWVWEKLGSVLYTRRVIELYNTRFSTQEQLLWPLLGLPNMRRSCIDQSGIGRQFAERAQERFGTSRIEGVTFTGPVKEDLAVSFRKSMEDRNVRIPDAAQIRADFRSIRKTTTSAGNIRFDAARTDQGHADRFWGGALGVHAAKPGAGAYYESVPQQDMQAQRRSI